MRHVVAHLNTLQLFSHDTRYIRALKYAKVEKHMFVVMDAEWAVKFFAQVLHWMCHHNLTAICIIQWIYIVSMCVCTVRKTKAFINSQWMLQCWIWTKQKKMLRSFGIIMINCIVLGCAKWLWWWWRWQH